MKLEDCFKFIDHNSDILVITMQAFSTSVLKNNNFLINEQLLPPVYILYKQKDNYPYDFLFLRDPYQTYYLTGLNKEDDTTFLIYTDIIKMIIKERYKKIVIMSASSSGYASLLFILQTNLKDIITELFVCVPQTNLLCEENKYLYNFGDNGARLKHLLYIKRKYTNKGEFIFDKDFSIIKALNEYNGTCKINIFVHRDNPTDLFMIKDINNNNININVVSITINNTHDIFGILFKQYLDNISNKMKKVCISLRGHVRNSFDDRQLNDFLLQLNSLYDLDIYIQTWVDNEAKSSHRKLAPSSFSVTVNAINEYFEQDINMKIKNILVLDDCEIELIGNQEGNISQTRMPRIGWKRMWHGIFKNHEIINEEYDLVIDMRFDFFQKSPVKCNILYGPDRGKKVLDKIDSLLNSNFSGINFLLDKPWAGIDNIFFGKSQDMKMFSSEFNNNLDNIENMFSPMKECHENIVYMYADILKNLKI